MPCSTLLQNNWKKELHFTLELECIWPYWLTVSSNKLRNLVFMLVIGFIFRCKSWRFPILHRARHFQTPNHYDPANDIVDQHEIVDLYCVSFFEYSNISRHELNSVCFQSLFCVQQRVLSTHLYQTFTNPPLQRCQGLGHQQLFALPCLNVTAAGQVLKLWPKADKTSSCHIWKLSLIVKNKVREILQNPFAVVFKV